MLAKGYRDWSQEMSTRDKPCRTLTAAWTSLQEYFSLYTEYNRETPDMLITSP